MDRLKDTDYSHPGQNEFLLFSVGQKELSNEMHIKENGPEVVEKELELVSWSFTCEVSMGWSRTAMAGINAEGQWKMYSEVLSVEDNK